MSTERGFILYQTRRYAEAEREYRAALGSESGDSLAHAMLALCLSQQQKLADATLEAEEAIRLRPNWGFAHYVRAQVMLDRNRFADASESIGQAIAFDSFNPSFHGLLAAILMQKRDWRGSLAAADAGLAIDPENDLCLNMRAQALVKLNDRGAAQATLQGALNRNPENASTHANQGWALLHDGQPRPAMEHFREALRLDPGSQWAKAGLVEALKARNIIYRLMLRYFLFMSRLGTRLQWGIIIGAYVGSQVLHQAIQTYPQVAPYLLPIELAYILFALMTWLANPIFNLLLRLDRFGRYALSKDQTHGANLVGLAFAAALACGVAALITRDLVWVVAAMICVGCALPLSAIFRCSEGWPRRVMAIYAAAVVLSGICLIWSLLPDSPLTPLFGSLRTIFLVGIFLNAWVANALTVTTVRR